MAKKSLSRKEEWRLVDGIPYEVSSYGRVRSLRAKIPMSLIEGKDGYLYIILRRRSLRINRLVCAAFHGPAPTKIHQAAHKDGNQRRNHKSNLYWATPKQNYADRIRHGTTLYGQKNPASKLKNSQALKIMRLKGFVSSTVLGERYKVDPRTIRYIWGRQRFKTVTDAAHH